LARSLNPVPWSGSGYFDFCPQLEKRNGDFMLLFLPTERVIE
jgi:hypothetical protein